MGDAAAGAWSMPTCEPFAPPRWRARRASLARPLCSRASGRSAPRASPRRHPHRPSSGQMAYPLPSPCGMPFGPDPPPTAHESARGADREQRGAGPDVGSGPVGLSGVLLRFTTDRPLTNATRLSFKRDNRAIALAGERASCRTGIPIAPRDSVTAVLSTRDVLFLSEGLIHSGDLSSFWTSDRRPV